MQAQLLDPVNVKQVRLWQALANAGEATVRSLCDEVGVSYQTAAFRLQLWLGAGLVARVGTRPHRYSFAVDHSAMPPVIDRAGQARPRRPAYQRIWSAIRVLRQFELADLEATTGASHRSVLGYLGLLQRTGYIRLVRIGSNRAGRAGLYQLISNPGPVAPRETIVIRDGRRIREFVDGNTGTRIDISAGTPSHRRAYRGKTEDDRAYRGKTEAGRACRGETGDPRACRGETGEPRDVRGGGEN